MTKPTLSTYGGALNEVGYAGELATMNPISTRTRVNSGTVLIQFGNAVARGATDDTCKAPTADGDKIIGLAVRHPTKVADSSGNIAYAQYDALAILADGDIYAVPTENVVRDDAVISITASNGALSGSTAGAAGTGRVTVPGATWETTTLAGAVGKIRIAN
jgi:hypothetical protein